MELDPWQKWVVIHLGELLPDGRPRFRTVLILVARQNGKTALAKVLSMYWMLVEQVALILATSTNRSYAKETWLQLVDELEALPWIKGQVKVRRQMGEESVGVGDSTYRFAASNRKAGRSLTVHRLILDELREHQSFDAWGSATNAMRAVPGAQAVAITNQGDNDSVVLDSLRNSALDHIETGTGDERLGLFEWSAPQGAEVDDPAAIAAANPDLGNRITLDSIRGDALRAKSAGGEELASFRTEVLCQRVHLLDAAIDAGAWSSRVGKIANLANHRDRLVLCLDVAIDQSHATLLAAAELDGVVHLDVVKAWEGHGCTRIVRLELADLVRKVGPRAVGWFPQGPAAALTADFRTGWVPSGTELTPITGDLTAACMGFATAVNDGLVLHTDDPLLNRHVTMAQRLKRGDAWVFTRRGSDAVDAAYAAAGALWLARTLPPPPSKLYAA